MHRAQGSHRRVPPSDTNIVPSDCSPTDDPGATRPRATSARSCFKLRRHLSSISRVIANPKLRSTIRAEERRVTGGNEDRMIAATTSKANCFLQSTGGTLPIVTGYVNKKPVRICIDSGANVPILSANALSDYVGTHAWVSRDEIGVLNRSICPKSAATLDIGLGTTNVRLENVVAEVTSTIVLILGSDWRRIAKVDITFRTTDHIKIVPVEPGEKVVTLEASPSSAARRTAETLISSFCRQTNNRAFGEDGFMRLNTKCPAPGVDFTRPEDDATQEMTKDATEADSDKLRTILLKPYLLSTRRSSVTAATAHSDLRMATIRKIEGDIDECQGLHGLKGERTDTRERLPTGPAQIGGPVWRVVVGRFG
ncbi:hypothetical protein MTO96_033717 [Rhipicephalus appendiculatus]